MKNVFIFEDDSWWDQPGCSCCEAYLMECYNCTSHEINYSVHDELSCIQASLKWLTGQDFEEAFDADDDSLVAALVAKYGIRVCIVDSDRDIREIT